MGNINMEQNNHDAPLDVSDSIVDHLKRENKALQARVDRYEGCIQDVLDYISECKGSAISMEGRITAIENTLSKALSAGEGENSSNKNKI